MSARILLGVWTPRTLLDRSLADPHAVFFCAGSRRIARGGRSVHLTQNMLTIIGALLARAGGCVTFQELEHALWGDDVNGGPNNTRGALWVHICVARKLLAPLGFRVYRERQFSYGIVMEKQA